MTYKMFLDDERFPVTDGWVIVRDFASAVEYVCKNGFPNEISFDHDLGEGPTGHKFALWLIERDLDYHDMPDDFDYDVHSQNPVGAENIRSVLNSYLRIRNAQRRSLS